MDAQSIWLLVLAVATPVAGVVGFAVQVSTVKQTQLENEKLRLEVEALKAEREMRGRMVKVATTEEILMVRRTGRDGPMFSRTAPESERNKNPNTMRRSLQAKVAEVAAISAGLLLVLAFVAYLLFDLYRLGRWVLGLLGIIS
ncbi:hypothetical protein [Hydrogenophaga sp.]|uniref:hypothetical protein n=1 Tax=Hydrogenophaga sp. TaxID=1904254 RepID=UPI002730C737|nr:hypothetical protein [Hydrogenophaga sp.]MDP1686471.1 hypothetical protein [Hydrogenophaga sp.]